jgi:shikimate kinase
MEPFTAAKRLVVNSCDFRSDMPVKSNETDPSAKPPQDSAARRIHEALGSRSLVLIGLMGAGKSAIGRRLGKRLGLRFVDADKEIEAAAGKSINEIFADHGEDYFRDGERRVIARLLSEGPIVLATGGGAYMNEDTRAEVAESGFSIWLKADLDVLMERVSRRDTRPLLKAGDPREIMQRLMDERYPVYAGADITIESRNVPHEIIVEELVEAIAARLLTDKADRSDDAASGQ